MHMYTKKGRGSVYLFLKTNGIYYKQAGACKALEKSMYFPVLAEQKTKSSANISIDAKKKSVTKLYTLPIIKLSL